LRFTSAKTKLNLNGPKSFWRASLVWSILVFCNLETEQVHRILLLLEAQVGWRSFCDWKDDSLNDIPRTVIGADLGRVIEEGRKQID